MNPAKQLADMSVKKTEIFARLTAENALFSA